MIYRYDEALLNIYLYVKTRAIRDLKKSSPYWSYKRVLRSQSMNATLFAQGFFLLSRDTGFLDKRILGVASSGEVLFDRARQFHLSTDYLTLTILQVTRFIALLDSFYKL